MITLETIVESIKMQLKPHITEDVILHDSWLIQMVNESRAALMKALFVSGDNLISFYQEYAWALIETDGSTLKKFNLPSKLMEGIGRKNILYVGPGDMNLPNFHYCSFEELISYSLHRFGSTNPSYADMSDHLLISNYNDVEIRGKFIFESPNDIPFYDYKETAYPIGANNVRQLELITFDHILPKIGLPTDTLNDGIDSTKGVGIGQQAQIEAQNKQIEAQQEAFQKNIKQQAQQLFDQRELANEQIESNQKQIESQRIQLELQKQQFEKQERLQAQQSFDQRDLSNEQIEANRKQLESQKIQLDLQQEQFNKQSRLQAQQVFDQNMLSEEQVDSNRSQVEAQKNQSSLQNDQYQKQLKLQTQQLFDQREQVREQIEAQQKQIEAQQKQLDLQKEQYDKQMRLQAQQIFDQASLSQAQLDSNKEQLEAQRLQSQLQKEQFDKQIRLQAQQLFDQSANVDEQMDMQRDSLNSNKQQRNGK